MARPRPGSERSGWAHGAWSRPLDPVVERLELGGPEGRDAVIAVIADTHGRPHGKAVERVAAMAPDAILHAGDVGPAGCLDAFRAVAPLVVVRGNIDGLDWPDSRLISVCVGSQERLRVLLTHIAVDRLAPSRVALAAARDHRADLIVCGHSHVPFVTRHGEGEGLVFLFNPGSCGPRRFGLPIVVGRLGLGRTLSLTHIDVESGQTWRPG